ncbi:MAG: DNA polymerase III, subunit gamma and tau [Legionellales bacterium RIFCSPHIGHO2_12_FULL_42_9]|nr:MAG: DNA polymerase III, subunit gamma and tau [Legionellales bacterium RIFCSPHIGHO2_12_FULL_42_9]
MSYLALARRWRPRTFAQLIGQEQVSQALINSLNQKRLHHAYLFTGTRGVGKTSVARLLAKALNCEQGITSEPCLQCDACTAIEQGCFVDLIEIDAASKTRVEDTRELLENVQYATNTGRFKIYLIDEVHMLSQHSFNALLKTLEEPPSHVKFLLATTDPQKLPITVLSRCLQFNLKHLVPDVICKQLQTIINEEKREFSEDALMILAKAAHGSMRDALSILDQVLVSYDDAITAAQVKSVLGYTQQDFALQLLKSLINQDGIQVVTLSRQIAEEGSYFTYVLDELINYLHQITLHHVLPSEHLLLTSSAEIRELAQQLGANDTQLFYQIALLGAKDMVLAPTLVIGFEMTLLRMLSFRPVNDTTLAPQPQEKTTMGTQNKVQNLPKPKPKESTTTKNEIPSPLLPPTEPTLNKQSPKKPTSATLVMDDNWNEVLPKLGLTGMTRTAAQNAAFIMRQDNEFTFEIQPGHQSLFSPTITERLEQALCNYYQQKIKLILRENQTEKSSPAKTTQIEHQLRQENAQKNIKNDLFLQELEQKFSAEIIKSSISSQEDDL